MVAIMQLTITPDAGPQGMVVGTMGLLTVVDGNSTESQGTFTYMFPAPGALALLGLAGLAGVRRRRG
jgi:uncharacterized protein (TIGR03382 family)